MKRAAREIGLDDVRAVYSGPEGDLWELVMGEQIHVGGFQSSMSLAKKAGIGEGWRGVDLCCCTGAGMRFLVRFCGVEHVTGVDATERMVGRGRERSEREGLSDRTEFVLADVCDSGLASESVDFVWGEDAWCYVVDKEKLIAEAVRMTRPGGVIAFSDWVEGPDEMTPDEAERLLEFMKFPGICDRETYRELLQAHGCEVTVAEHSGRFAPHVDLYLGMLGGQLGYDALKIIGFDTDRMEAMAEEMKFMRRLAHAGKLSQGVFVARKGTQTKERP